MLNETNSLSNEEKNAIKQFLEFYESVALFQGIVSIGNQISLNEKLFVEFLHKSMPVQMITKNDDSLNKTIEVMLNLIYEYLFLELKFSYLSMFNFCLLIFFKYSLKAFMVALLSFIELT